MSKYQAYEKYKDSGVEWLGDIPKHWEALKIKRLTFVKRGASPRPIDDPKYFDEDGEYAWVRIADVTASDHYLENTTQRLSELGKSFSVPLEPGELFLSIAGSVGKPMITKIKCCIHDGFVYFPDLKINRKLIYYIFYSGQPYLGLGKLGTQLNLNTETVGAITIGLPPLDEQEAIANFLDHKTKQIDDLIAKKEALLAKLDEKRSAIISHAVTKGLDPTVPMKDSGIEWLGKIPNHWEILKIKYLTKILRGKFSHRPRNDPKLYDGQYAFIQTGDVANANKFIIEYSQTLNEDGYAVSKEFPSGTLVMTIAANIGDMAILNFNACFPDSIVGFIPCNKTSVLFLYYLFTSMKKQFLSTAVLNTQLNLNIERISNLFTVIAPIDEQDKIITFLDQQIKNIDQQKAKVQEAIERLKEYRTALITNAVTGKIDVRQVPLN